MTRNTQFSDTNLELHRRWVELNEHEDQESSEVVTGKRNLANEVIETNRRMLGAEIRKYTARNPQLEPDLFDTAGAELWRAFQKWDPDRGTLRTVAMPYISGAVRREVARNDHPHLTYDDFTLRNKVLQARHRLELKLKREPTTAELSEESKVPEQKISILFAGKPLSLDASPGSAGDSDMTLGDIIAESHVAEDTSEEQAFSEFNAVLEQEAVDSAGATQLLAYLMREPGAAGAPARSAEIAYMLGLPNNGKTMPREVTNLVMENAYVKLSRLIGNEPTAEQLSTLASVSTSQAEKFLVDHH